MFYTYIYKDPETNVPFYVGKGRGRRAYRHLYETEQNTTNRIRWSKIQSLRKRGLAPIVVICNYYEHETDALLAEAHMIEQYGRLVDHTGTLTNILEGGKQPPKGVGNPTWKFDNPSSKTKGKSYEERYGHIKANIIKSKRSSSLLGRQFSDETKQKMKQSAKRRDRSHQKKQIQTPDGIFNSMSECAVFYKVSASTITNRVAAGKYQLVG